MTTTTIHCRHQPLVVSASFPLSSAELLFVPDTGRRGRGSRRGTRPYPHSFITCRRLEDDKPCSSSNYSITYNSIKDDESLVILNGVRNVLSKAKAASVLRMAFHDAGTFDVDDNSGGMNGSIIYELDRPENAGLSKPLKVLEKAKREIEKIRQVSWADLIAVAGAEAILLCGGPAIPVQVGRLDVRKPDPDGKLPEESFDASGLKRCFLRKGFSTQELVVLSGAHTLGSKGFGNPNVFDNAYFKILLEKPWASSGGMSNMIGLPSDRALVEDDECLRWIKIYADDEVRFFDDFKKAYIKLVDSGASWTIA